MYACKYLHTVDFHLNDDDDDEDEDEDDIYRSITYIMFVCIYMYK